MRKWIYVALLVVFILIFLFSGAMLLDYYVQSNRASESFDNLAQMVDKVKKTQPTAPEGDLEPTVELVELMHPVTGESCKVLPEYVDVFMANPDTVGWISIDGTRVNYPVMHRPEDKDFYLDKDFYMQPSKSGSIYIREDCDVFRPSDNVTIYGHRMNSGAMFADVLMYKDPEFYHEHPHIRFDTLRHRNYYVVMAVFTISASIHNGFQYHQFVDAADEAEFDSFVQQCKDRALYDTGITAQYGDKLITLSTCEKFDSNTRVVVVAKLIR